MLPVLTSKYNKFIILLTSIIFNYTGSYLTELFVQPNYNQQLHIPAYLLGTYHTLQAHQHNSHSYESCGIKKKKKTKKPCNSHWITFIQTKQCITIKWVLRETQNRRQVRNEMTKHLIIKTDTKYGFDSNSFFLFLFFKSSPEDIFSLLLEREERRGEGRETLMWERSVDWLPPVSTWNRDWTHNLCMCPDQASNPQPFDYRIWHSNQLSQTAQGQAP